MRLLARRLAAARTQLAQQRARIRELELKFDAEHERVLRLTRACDVDHTTALEKEIQALTAQLAELRAGQPDTPLIGDLRRRLRLSERARAELAQQLAVLQAANEADARAAYTRRWAA